MNIDLRERDGRHRQSLACQKCCDSTCKYMYCLPQPSTTHCDRILQILLVPAENMLAYIAGIWRAKKHLFRCLSTCLHVEIRASTHRETLPSLGRMRVIKNRDLCVKLFWVIHTSKGLHLNVLVYAFISQNGWVLTELITLSLPASNLQNVRLRTRWSVVDLVAHTM